MRLRNYLHADATGRNPLPDHCCASGKSNPGHNRIFNERGFVITSAQNGIINTDYKAASGLATALMGEMRSKVNAIITRAGESTKITLTLVLEEKSNFSGWKTASVPASQSAKMYQQYLDEIEKRSLEKKF